MTKGKPPRVPTAELIAAYETGKTLRDLSAIYGISHQGFYQQLRNAGYSLRSNRIRKPGIRHIPCAICGTLFIPYAKTKRTTCFTCVPAVRGSPRKTKCKRGHVLTSETVYVSRKTGQRRCKLCVRAEQERYRKRKRKQNKEKNEDA